MTIRLRSPRLIHVEMEIDGALRLVGDLAWRDRRAFFQYDPSFIENGPSLSPVKLPLNPRLFEASPSPFDGLHGLFNDSLPDGWGRLLLDRTLQRAGLQPTALTALDRLAYVGSRGMGALRYRPEYETPGDGGPIDLDALDDAACLILSGDSEAVLAKLLDLNGSSGGARPKVLVGLSADQRQIIHGVDALPPGFDPWMVKFIGAADPVDNGAIELAYARMAASAGIDMMETRLFPSRSGPGYFGVKRFDRVGAARIHVHTICGMLDAAHRLPSIGYETLLKATRMVTRNQAEVEKVFDRMVFNVVAHNRDDHTKNHAFMLQDMEWRATPAYDLTFSAGPGGEHCLDIAGNGQNPGVREMLAVAKAVGITENRARASLTRVGAAVARWAAFAEACGVSSSSATRIEATLDVHLRELSQAGVSSQGTPRSTAAPSGAPEAGAHPYLGRMAATKAQLLEAKGRGDQGDYLAVALQRRDMAKHAVAQGLVPEIRSVDPAGADLAERLAVRTDAEIEGRAARAVSEQESEHEGPEI
jgi:serine/threonine-protein kinase HipA